RTKNKLFSIIAHDLKNPFQGIIGFSELIIKEAEKQSSEKIKKYSQYIYDVSLQSYKLLDNLLDFTRSQTGLIKYNPEYFNIAEPVKETVLLVKSNADAKGVNLIDEVTENSEELKVFADKSMIATVLRNLISNAVKFTPSGGTVRISAKLEDDNLILKVADTGVGIKESDIPKLFKADLNFSTFGTRNEKGTGLGLVVCKDFIDKNNGTISVKSKVGKGSVFTITLPVKK
ncbi:MAG: HAMP domain-containing histidine kinase, partial [Chlorobi bacterium]|nr:HAMP domain-containing histidine kinase [Chlorobiota bacterium]